MFKLFSRKSVCRPLGRTCPEGGDRDFLRNLVTNPLHYTVLKFKSSVCVKSLIFHLVGVYI